jgi:superfamily II DNA or RNA helicase
LKALLGLLQRDPLFSSGEKTCGLYIGEMKNADRKVSEAKDVILGTFKLASVGMDIPSLNTLLLASPRKEIEQSVGRILRKDHEVHPLIIDIIDNHNVFKSQARERKKFYKTYGYTVVHIHVEPNGTIKSSRTGHSFLTFFFSFAD